LTRETPVERQFSFKSFRVSKTGLFLVANTIFLLLLVEFVAYLFLVQRGYEASYLVSNEGQVAVRGGGYYTLDPHLGYAHGPNEDGVKTVTQEYSWVGGFVVYSDSYSGPSELERPVILTLGGSTTDGAKYGHSWPEHLAKRMAREGLPGTVVNGGTGGYSTTQELFKLVRDGLVFEPDLVISYSGVNDRGDYNEERHPMVHPYQARLFNGLVQPPGSSPVMPSTVKALTLITNPNLTSTFDLNFGPEFETTLSNLYEQNVLLMKAVSEARGSDFMAFIQPYRYLDTSEIANLENPKRRAYAEKIVVLYDELSHLPDAYEFVVDARYILADHPELFKNDGTHLTDEGDRFVSDFIFSNIAALFH
jgi:lysophospholipase L1-like esterase